MSTLKFDVPAPTPPAILDAAITSVQVLDLDGNPNLVVEAGSGFNVPVRWSLTGVLAPLVINDWHIRLFAESIGGGFEGKLAEVTAAVPTLISPTHVQYDAVLNVPAATTNLLVNAEGDGVYELVVVIAHDNVVNARDTMAGFADGIVIEVRKP
jgi:hypothetical protein